MSLRLVMVHPRLRSWGSGHDAAVHRLVVALAARPDVRLRLVVGRCEAASLPPGVEVVRLPVVPVWHGGLEFLSFRLAWRVLGRRVVRPGEVVWLGSPLLGAGDLAAVHFLSVDWQEADRRAAPPRSWRLRLRRLHDAWRHAIAARLERRLYAAPDAPRLLPVSGGLAGRIVANFGPHPGLTVVPNIIDTNHFRPAPETVLDATVRAEAGWPEGLPIVLFVGGAWQRKGLETALEALAALRAGGRAGGRAGVRDAGLLVVGPGPRRALTDRAQALGLAGRVHAVGMQRDTAPFYRIATVLVHPSVYETDSLVAWEALASALPVVAAPFAGAEGWLRDGETALAAEGPTATAAALARLLEDAPMRQRLGAAGRELAATRGPQAVAAQVVALAAHDGTEAA